MIKKIEMDGAGDEGTNDVSESHDGKKENCTVILFCIQMILINC